MAKKGALEHPKTLTLADALDIMDCFALGILEAFWHHVSDYFEDGDVTNLKPSIFCRSIRYTGNSQILWESLINAGFIDVVENRLIVHDWDQHCIDSIHSKFFRAKKRFANGKKPKAVNMGKEERSRLEEEWAAMEETTQFEPKVEGTEPELSENNLESIPKVFENSLPNLTLPNLTKPSLINNSFSPPSGDADDEAGDEKREKAPKEPKTHDPDPWYDPDAFPNEDPLLALIGQKIGSVPKFRQSSLNRGSVETVLGKFQAKFPRNELGELDPEEVSDFLEEWADFNRKNSKKGGASDGCASLRNWLTQKESSFAAVKRAREDAKKSKWVDRKSELKTGHELAAEVFA